MSEILERSPFDLSTERKVVIIADWLPPDFGAVGQYMQLRARALAQRGHDVTLVGLSSRADSIEQAPIGEGSLTEIRIRSSPVPRHSLLRRLLWTLGADLRLVGAAFAHLRTAGGILFTGSPPFLIHLLAPLRFLWPGRLVYRITDFHPECVIAARERPSLALSLMLSLTNFWRRRIDAFEVLGEDQRRRLCDAGVPAERIALVRDGSPVTFGADVRPEPRPAELAGSCVLLYSGNYGVAHDVETVAEGYELHHRHGTGRVRLWLSAAGEGAELLAKRLARAGLPFHRSPPRPLEQLPGVLLAADAHLVSLKDPFVGFVMPSKVYACLDSGKPLIFVGSDHSDVDLLARRQGNAYWRVSCGDSRAFAEALEALAERSGRAGQQS
jgi:glycosyltransferase involved in cell wall biosynthesis